MQEQLLEELVSLLCRIEDLSERKGLLLNAKKTKVMVIDKTRTHYNALTVNGQQPEGVKDFIYLGSMVNTESNNICKKSIEELTSQEHRCKKWTRSGGVKQSTTN